MSKLDQRLAVLAVCAIALHINAPATAAVRSSAALTNITWELADTDPLDGVEPALLIIGTGINQATSNSYSTLFEAHGQGSAAGTGDVGASARLVAGQTADALVVTGSAGQLTQLSLSVGGTTTPSAPDSFGQFDATVASRDWVFTLAPHTQVLFTATTALDVELTGGGAESSIVTASLWVANLPTSLPGAILPDGVRREELQDIDYISLLTSSAPKSQRNLGTVSVMFDNLSDGNATGYLSAMAYVYGHSMAAPVPEPEAWAMLLAGLGLLLRQITKRSQWQPWPNQFGQIGASERHELRIQYG